MKRVRTTPAGLADELNRLGQQFPKAVEQGMVEGATLLQGALVQREIAASSPQPVDQGQYKAAWTMTEVEGGAVVGNTTKQALWVERGRAPGPTPFGPILEWVRRKGFVRAAVKAVAKARGTGRDSKGRFQGASQSEIDQAEKTAALAIKRKIEQQGIEPRWVLRRAIDALRSKMPAILRRSVREVGA